MPYTENHKQAIYRYRDKVKDTENFKAKVRAYTARGWERVKADPERLEQKRVYERDAYYRHPDRILMAVRLLFKL